MAQPLASSAPMVKAHESQVLLTPSVQPVPSAAGAGAAGANASGNVAGSPAPSIHVPQGQSQAGTPNTAHDTSLPLSARNSQPMYPAGSSAPAPYYAAAVAPYAGGGVNGQPAQQPQPPHRYLSGYVPRSAGGIYMY